MVFNIMYNINLKVVISIIIYLSIIILNSKYFNL